MISKLLADWIMKHRPSREPDFLIGPEGDPYMRRWWVIPRNKWFKIYLHHMRHDDDDRAAHDHPWWSMSLCLDGCILEHEMLQEGDKRIPLAVHDEHDRPWWSNVIIKGMWKWRGSSYIHRLELPYGDAWTLFMTGPRIKSWGFFCPKGFVHWKEFTDPGDYGKRGRGCGEEDTA